jgi:2-polyprenyl-3-methyl-5-hydroxy-6-metoxy-1,4-benzoquinol methylase
VVEKNPTETVEFFTPTKGLDVAAYLADGDLQGIHHVGRYQWATLALAQKRPARVLDIACGAGYGSFMLAQALPGAEVIGADYDERALEFARANYRLPNLSFHRGDLVTGILDDESFGRFDAIVSFDTIEHISHRELAFVHLAGALSDDGWMLFSTPARKDGTLLNPDWEHHKIEYSDYNLFKVLAHYFERIIEPQDEDFPVPDFWTETVNKPVGRYPTRLNPVVCARPRRIPRYERRWVSLRS